MTINRITTDDLCRMKDKEGLILQGCGGDPQEWVNGVNQMLKEANIFLDNTRFENVYVFNHDGLTNIMFPMDNNVHLDIDKLAMWRLQSHKVFAGTWLSDYVSNRFGGFISEKEEEQPKEKPDCKLIGEDGNIFNLMGIASITLKQKGLKDEAKEMCDRIIHSNSYYEALNIIGEYVNITDNREYDENIKMSI